MLKKILTVFLFIVCFSFQAFSWIRTPEAGRFYFYLFSPDLLSRGMGAGGTTNPSGIILNPASNGFVQNVTFEASYGLSPALIAGTQYYTGRENNEHFYDAGDFFLPFMVNGGFVIPSQYGNFTTYLSYMNMSNQEFKTILNLKDTLGYNNSDLGIGKIGAVYFNFSKEYEDNFSFGFGGNLKFSYNPLASSNKFDVGGGLDIGFIFRPDWQYIASKKTPWGIQDFEFSLALKEIGKPLINFANLDSSGNETWGWFPGFFTHTAGMSFNFYNDGSTYWKWLMDISTPFFQNLTFAMGTEVQIYKFLVLRGSYTFDLEGTLEYAKVIPQYEYMYNIYNFSFGLSFRFRSDFAKKQTKEQESANIQNVTQFSIDVGGRPYSEGFIFELGFSAKIGLKDTIPPKADSVQKDYYISPNNDGIQDKLRVDIKNIKEDRYIKYWKFEVKDKDGKVVRVIEGKEPRKETMKFEDVVKKYFAPRKGITVPNEIVWDGKNNSGEIVADGKYTFTFYAMDDNKNMKADGIFTGEAVVDNSVPLIKYNVVNKVFSPTGTGTKDTAIVDIEIVKKKVENILEPLPVLGLEKEEIKKNKELSNHDLKDIDAVKEKIDSQEIIVAKTEPKKPAAKTTKTDSTKTTAKSETVSVKDDATSDLAKLKNVKQLWHVDYLDASGKVVRSYVYDKLSKDTQAWDGKDNAGNKVPDGVYSIKFWSRSLGGTYWETIEPNFIIDTVPRPIEATVLDRAFSPGTKSPKSTIGFKFNVPITKGIQKWEYEISDKDNKVAKVFKGEGMPPVQFSWNGKTDGDATAAESIYKGKLTCYYENGQSPNGVTPTFILRTTPPKGDAAVNKDIFNPKNHDTKLRDVKITQSGSDEEEWFGYVTDVSGKKVKTFNWKNIPPKEIVFDGKGDNSKILPDGDYYYSIASTDIAGNYFESAKKKVKIFTEDTPVTVVNMYDSFNPKGDKKASPDVILSQVFEFGAKTIAENKLQSWELQIKDEKNNIAFSNKKTGELPKTFEWNGKNNSGLTCQDGDYTATLVVNFSASNSEAGSNSFSIKSVGPRITIKPSTNIFSPNADSNLDIFEIAQDGTQETQWEEYIYNSDNLLVWKNIYGGKPVAKEVWNGKDLNGNIQKNGNYRYVISATDNAGNLGKAESTVELKNVFTNAFVVLDNTMFSPTANGNPNTVKIRPIVNVKDDISSYKVDILNKDKKVVKTFTGEKTVPESVEWNGLDSTNKIAEDGSYAAKLQVIYRFGNKPEATTGEIILDKTAPKIDIDHKPELFSPDDDGIDDELTMKINAGDLSGIKNWKISILAPNGKFDFKTFSGTGKPAEAITWNGISNDGELVDSAEDYPVKVVSEDNVGNVLDKQADIINTDILVIKQPDGRLKIKISNINFKPDSAEMTDDQKNLNVLKKLTSKLKKFGSYKITVEGHANKFITGTYFEARAKDLSLKRAVTIANYLDKNGVSKSRMTIDGKGGEVPIYIPAAEKDMTAEQKEKNQLNLEKNRRVEFYLEKK
jgi:outer membrane protein OmpA-like peptidoglycan-associated protein/flagellar hook assembly protein FlgD